MGFPPTTSRMRGVVRSLTEVRCQLRITNAEAPDGFIRSRCSDSAPKKPRLPLRAVSVAASSTEQQSSDPSSPPENRSHQTDVVIIGSGIGGAQNPLISRTSVAKRLHLLPPHAVVSCPLPAGLCCAALLARYGYKVTVCEAHYHAGGAAHGFEVQGHEFDAGPSFFAGLSGPPLTPTSNPLKQVLDAVGESVECVTYNSVRPNPEEKNPPKKT